MPYSAQHVLTTFGGSLPGGEQWATSFRSAVGTGPIDVDAVGALLAIEWARSSNPCAAPATLAWAKSNPIGLDGKYASDTTNLWEAATPVPAGGGSATLHPNQVSLVVTLETVKKRGLACRGRMFLPLPKFKPSVTTGLISTAEATSATAWVAGLLIAYQNLPGTGFVGVFSDVREGAVNRVTHVTCGVVLDTMRSRRAQIDDTRVPGTVVPFE